MANPRRRYSTSTSARSHHSENRHRFRLSPPGRPPPMSNPVHRPFFWSSSGTDQSSHLLYPVTRVVAGTHEWRTVAYAGPVAEEVSSVAGALVGAPGEDQEALRARFER